MKFQRTIPGSQSPRIRNENNEQKRCRDDRLFHTSKDFWEKS